jgi:hypothetical protein
MKKDTKKITVSMLVIGICMVFVLPSNNKSNVLFATDQLTNAPTFSVKGIILPLNVINPITDEYYQVSGTWMSTKEE